MNQSQYNQLFSFIWNIATDVLVYAFEKGDYKKIILPMMVLRRIDVLLEPTKQQLLTQKELLDKYSEPGPYSVQCNWLSVLQHIEVHDEDAEERDGPLTFEDELHGLSEWFQQGCAGHHRQV